MDALTALLTMLDGVSLTHTVALNKTAQLLKLLGLKYCTSKYVHDDFVFVNRSS